MNFLLTILLLHLIHIPVTQATITSSTPQQQQQQQVLPPTGSIDNTNGNTYDYTIINKNRISNNVHDKDISFGNLDSLEGDFTLSSLSHSQPVSLLSPSSPSSSSLSGFTSSKIRVPILLSQSKSYSSPSSSMYDGQQHQQQPQLASSSFSTSYSSPSSSSSSTESTSSPVSSSGSYFSLISSSKHHPNQLADYYLQITKPQQQQSSPSSSVATAAVTQQQHQQSINNNDDNQLNIKTPRDIESLFHRIARRSSRPYDVPQIECPLSEDGVDRFACPTPNKEGRYRCIEDHELCNGYVACPNGEDEDRKLCMFYKTTKAHLDVLADAMLRIFRGFNRGVMGV